MSTIWSAPRQTEDAAVTPEQIGVDCLAVSIDVPTIDENSGACAALSGVRAGSALLRAGVFAALTWMSTTTRTNWAGSSAPSGHRISRLPTAPRPMGARVHAKQAVYSSSSGCLSRDDVHVSTVRVVCDDWSRNKGSGAR